MSEDHAEKDTLGWYTVKSIFERYCSGEPDPEKMDEYYEENTKRFFEENIMLVKAHSEKEAYDIVAMIAKEQQTEFTDEYGQTVHYEWVEAVDCFGIFAEELETGTELLYFFIDAPIELSREEFIARNYPWTRKKVD